MVKIESKDYYVKISDDEILRCSLRGKFKKEYNLKKDKLLTLDFASLGDWVEITKISNEIGVIESIHDRKNYLSRKAGKLRGGLKRGRRFEQIIASNIDKIYIVASIIFPEFNNRFIDRVIVAAESANIDFSIVINKIDLDENNNSQNWEQFYKSIGYNVFRVSAKRGDSISELKENLSGNVNLFWGQSGVGKSSILNSMFPHLDFRVGEVSNYSQKGIHTTVTGEFKKVAENTYIVDTPGIREIDPYGIKKEDLSHYFMEFKPFLQNCKFNTCNHDHEPDCAVLDAVEKGKISIERYQSYLNILNTIEDDMFY
ncbi:MAG: ribosome small subunit-dependent GTPase A [Ignavibacteriae bacterium]|nr:ribosome small subunit-dependent GTPase A [Ignavibacteriota bacterium]